MAGHVHAELMAQYAEDAKRTECPWLNWQSRKNPPRGTGTWFNLPGNPSWSTDCEYRRKPAPVTTYHLMFDDGSMSCGFESLTCEEIRRRITNAGPNHIFVRIVRQEGVPIVIEKVGNVNANSR